MRMTAAKCRRFRAVPASFHRTPASSASARLVEIDAAAVVHFTATEGFDARIAQQNERVSRNLRERALGVSTSRKRAILSELYVRQRRTRRVIRGTKIATPECCAVELCFKQSCEGFTQFASRIEVGVMNGHASGEESRFVQPGSQVVARTQSLDARRSPASERPDEIQRDRSVVEMEREEIACHGALTMRGISPCNG